MAAIHRLFCALPKSNVVAQRKNTACNPNYLWCAKKRKMLRHEGNSQLFELQDISLAQFVDMKVFSFLMGLQKGYAKFCVSPADGIVVMPEVFTTARRTGLSINHINLEQSL